MPANVFKLETTHWPYGLEIRSVEGGLLLRPQRKAREGWAKRFRNPQEDELLELRSVCNDFDEKGWEW